MRLILFATTCCLLLFACKKDDLEKLDNNNSIIDSSTFVLDFKVEVNCDSTRLYKCFNLSKGYTNFKWTFDDSTISYDSNPEHFFNSINTGKKVILTATDLNGNTKSITRTFDISYVTYRLESCAVILINTNPVKLRFYEAKSSYEDISPSHIAHYYGSNIDTIIYHDSTELILNNISGIHHFRFIKIYPNGLTVYKIVRIGELENILEAIKPLNGFAHFHERYFTEEISYTPPRRTDYNDTTLKINLYRGAQVYFVDSIYKHSFSGYPVFWNYNNSNSSVIELSQFSTNSAYPFGDYSKVIKYNYQTKAINATYSTYQGGKISIRTKLIYNGTLL